MVRKTFWYPDGFEQEKGKTAFAPFKADTDYFGIMDQQFMNNFRVTDIEKLLTQLKEADVRIDKERMYEKYGKFTWIYDPKGNKIELWEPVPDEESK